MKLIDLSPGDKAEIVSVKAKGEVGARLLDMGIVKGSNFKFVRKAPLGDPIEIKIRGFLLALRKSEAESIDVNKIGEAGDGKPMRGERFRWGKRREE